MRILRRRFLDFYGSLMGTATSRIEGIDVVAMRHGKQLTLKESAFLITPMTEWKYGKL